METCPLSDTLVVEEEARVEPLWPLTESVPAPPSDEVFLLGIAPPVAAPICRPDTEEAEDMVPDCWQEFSSEKSASCCWT